MKLYLLRHAESASNAQGLTMSDDMEPLSDTGLAQAEALVPILSELPVNKVICSSLLRARQTVAPFIAATARPVEYSALLVEGQELLTSSDRSGDNAVSTEDSGYLAEPPANFISRVQRAAAWLQQQPHESLLVVTHGHVIRELLNHLLALPQRVRFPHDNAGLTVIDLGKTISVETINRPLLRGSVEDS